MPKGTDSGAKAMSTSAHPAPTEINLHRKSRLLSIAFSDGNRFELPCEYLRVHSQAAEVKSSDHPVTGKEQVNIERIEPQGNYAIRLVFDDGHDTGIYSWETLYQLGIDQDKNWQAYLQRIESTGYRRDAESASEPRQLQVLYFAYLARMLRRESETLRVPPSVNTVESLLEWLRNKWRERGYLLADDRVRVTVNRQFAETFTRLEAGDEVAITPNSPNPPPPPG
jgi:DUF971 family protein/molybdopterin converting factor small subunit